MRDDSNFVKLKCLQKELEVYHHKDRLGSFGYYGRVFCIKNNCNTNYDSNSFLGFIKEYELPIGIQLYTQKA